MFALFVRRQVGDSSMPWHTSELTEEEVSRRLSWFFDQRFHSRGVTKRGISEKTGVSVSTLARYASYHTDVSADLDAARVAGGGRPLSKQYPEGPLKLGAIIKITRALGYELDQVMFAVTRSTDEHSFELLLRSHLVAEFCVNTSCNGEAVSQVNRVEYQPARPEGVIRRQFRVVS
ncbi:hypothetical protein [Caulobacter sp. 17J65-9]|uniref:hypothetical protein n=1 Tax=Caulobacter sp. 17J65-9 TaxID=2709382 RepID=UPI0013CBFB3F|nr:hypothetical protein [Caulobacter sp. 17J65-9]NEX91152.1 hypothetical protein [Caulobacter sp. 17J65-9]